MAEICVIGAGPSGSVFAARMAQLGHVVWLIERARFPRPHLGESLSPGVLPMLASIGIGEATGSAGFRRAENVLVKWESGLQLRQDSHDPGWLVDRGTFDRILLDRARALGVRVLQPASVAERKADANGWHFTVAGDSGMVRIRADFLADASGRQGAAARTGRRTLALYAYWRGTGFPGPPRIEAGRNAWFWGVPLPDGSCNTLVFVDAKEFRAERSGSLEARFLALLGQSALLGGCRNACLASQVRAIDATPYLAPDSVTPSSIKLGEAALAIDPLSSSGVQKAVQSALAGAIVANTLLRRAGSGTAALAFYNASLAEASEQHCRWAAGHYGKVAAQFGGTFWRDRATGPPAVDLPPVAPRVGFDGQAVLSPHLDFVELPCLESEFVTVKTALRHPRLTRPVAWLGGRELVPLLKGLPSSATPLQMAQSWTNQMPLNSALAIAGWLINNGILVDENQASGASFPDDAGGRLAQNTGS